MSKMYCRCGFLFVFRTGNEDYDLMLIKKSIIKKAQIEVERIGAAASEFYWDTLQQGGICACKCPNCGRIYVETNNDGLFYPYIQEAKVIKEYGDDKILYFLAENINFYKMSRMSGMCCRCGFLFTFNTGDGYCDSMLIQESIFEPAQFEVERSGAEANEIFWKIVSDGGTNVCECPSCGRIYVEASNDGLFESYIQEGKVIDEYGDDMIL